MKTTHTLMNEDPITQYWESLENEIHFGLKLFVYSMLTLILGVLIIVLYKVIILTNF